MNALLSLIGPVLIPLVKWIISALWDIKERNHETIEVDYDRDLARRFFAGMRM